MSTYSQSLTGLTTGNPLPNTFVEVQFGAGAAGGDLSAKKVLLLAPSTAAGSIVQDTEVFGPINSEDDAIAKGGPGSPLHRMARYFLQTNKSAALYLCAPTRSAGVTASLVLTVGGTTATAAGVARVEICEEICDTNVLVGDTPTIIAGNLAAAINAKTHLPVTAANAAGVLTLTAKAAGPEGNAFRAIASIIALAPTGMTVSPSIETAFTSGATAATYTAALATILAQDFDEIVPHTHSGTSSDPVLAALATQVASQALPTSGIRQRVVAGTALAAATSVTLATSINKPRLDIVNLKESKLEPSVVAAIVAAVDANTFFGNPSYNQAGYGTTSANDLFPVLAPRNTGARATPTEQTLMINGGVTPIAVSASGIPYLVRRITSYSASGGQPDYRVRDAHRVYVADAFADDLSAKLRSSPYRKLTDDPPPDSDAQPPPEFATPKRIRALVEPLISAYCTRGHLDPAMKDEMLTSIACGIDPTLSTRVNIRVPIYSANLFLQSATLVAESSPAA